MIKKVPTQKKKRKKVSTHNSASFITVELKNDETEFQEMNFFHVNASALRSIEIQLADK